MVTRPLSRDYAAGWADCLQTLRMMVHMREVAELKRARGSDMNLDEEGLAELDEHIRTRSQGTRVLIDGCRCPTHTR